MCLALLSFYSYNIEIIMLVIFELILIDNVKFELFSIIYKWVHIL